jgi:hypothetical protein
VHRDRKGSNPILIHPQACRCVCVAESLKLGIVYVMNGTEHCVFVTDVSQTLFPHTFPASRVPNIEMSLLGLKLGHGPICVYHDESS